jgi:hypothetical protein
VDVFPLTQGFFFGPSAAAAGANVTIAGWNFDPATVTGVRFGAGPAVSPGSVQFGALVAAVPAGSTTGSVFLDLAGGLPTIALPGFTFLLPGEIPISGLTALADSPISPGVLGNFGANIAAGSNVTYSWNFGDGAPVVFGKNVTHAYSASGIYQAVVTATNSVGSVQASVFVVVAPGNDFTLLRVGSEALGQPNTFTAIVQVVGDATYGWNWGDGSPAETGQGLVHTFPNAGSYSVTVTVTDASGARVFTRVVVVIGLAETGKVINIPILYVQSGGP